MLYERNLPVIVPDANTLLRVIDQDGYSRLARYGDIVLVGGGYAGDAYKDTDPGTPVSSVYWICYEQEKSVYQYFDNIEADYGDYMYWTGEGWKLVEDPNKLTNTTPMPEDVGGWEAGSTFDDMPVRNVLNGLLYPYQYPAFLTFDIVGQAVVIEVGDKIPADVTFEWSTSNDANIEADTVSITDVTAGVTLLTASANDGTEAITMAADIIKTTQASNDFKIAATNSKDEVFSRDKVYYWEWRLYYGESDTATLDETAIKALRANILTTTYVRTYAMLVGGYKFIVFPTSFGEPDIATDFKDVDTGFAVAMEPPITISITNDFGQTTDYYVYRTTNIINGIINIKVS